MEQAIEKKLIQAAQGGNIEAFEKLIITYEKNIYNICYRMLGTEQDAFDAAQEVCIKIWKQLAHFEGTSKLSTWIYRVTTNHCLDTLRKLKNKRQNELPMYQTNSETGEEWEAPINLSSSPIEERVEQMALQDVLQLALDELKEEYRTIILLRDVENLSYEEIGKILQLSQGTVKSRLSRARKNLQNILKQNKEPFISFFRQTFTKEES